MDPEQPHRTQPDAPDGEPPSAAQRPVPGWVPVSAGGAEPAGGVERPGHVSAAAVLLMLLGVLVCLVGVLVLLAGVIFPTLVRSPELSGQLGDLPAGAGGLFIVLGGILAGWGVLEVVSGIYVLKGRSWARISGMILAALGMLFALVGVLPGEGGVTAGGLGISVAVLAAYAYVAWALITNEPWFRS